MTASECAVDLPCAASGHLTMRGWQPLENRPPEKVCAPLAPGCRRPCGVYMLYLKLAAGLLVSSAFLQPMLPKDNITWVESMTLADPKADEQLSLAQARGWPALTVLRHPVHRLVAQFFATVEEADGHSLAKWIARHSAKPPRRGNDGLTRLWIELDNAYTKIFSAYHGRVDHGAVDRAALEKAKATLAARFDHVLVAEWLGAPLTVAALGDRLCFRHERGRVSSGALPDLRSSRRQRRGRDGRAHEAYRAASYANASWWRAMRPALAGLAARNALDVELYAWASAHSRRTLEAHWRARYAGDSPPALPPLPCTREPGSYCWDESGPPVDAAVAIRG